MCLYLARWVYLCSYCYSLCLESTPQAKGQTAVNNSITETAALFNAKSANRRDNGQKNSRPSSRRQSALLLYDTVAHQAINVLYSLGIKPGPYCLANKISPREFAGTAPGCSRTACEKRRAGALFPGKGAGKKCKQRQQAI